VTPPAPGGGTKTKEELMAEIRKIIEKPLNMPEKMLS
jgi:hypothetical protein